MSRIHEEPLFYKNADLINEFNEMQIRIKTHLFDIGNEEFKIRYPKPTNDELNEMNNKIMVVLKQDSEPMIKH